MSVGEGNGIIQAPEGELKPYTIIIPEAGDIYFWKKTPINVSKTYFFAGKEGKWIYGVGEKSVALRKKRRSAGVPKDGTRDYNIGETKSVGKAVSLESEVLDKDIPEFMGLGKYMFVIQKATERIIRTYQDYSYYGAACQLMKAHGERYGNSVVLMVEPDEYRLGPVVPGKFEIEALNEEGAIRILVTNSLDKYNDDWLERFGPINVRSDKEAGYPGGTTLEEMGRKLFIERTTGCVLKKGWKRGKGPIKIIGRQLGLFNQGSGEDPGPVDDGFRPEFEPDGIDYIPF